MLRARATSLAIAIALVAGAAHADDVEAAREAYSRGAAAYDAAEYAKAAAELTRADDLAPNDVALELALKAAVKADDARLAMTLADRAEARGGSPSLVGARDAARSKMRSRTGRVTIACAPGTTCTARLDNVAAATGAATWQLVGEYQVAIEGNGRREVFKVRVDPGASVEVTGTLPPPPRPPGIIEHPPVAFPPAGLSPAFFWAGVGLTTVLGGATIASALDVQSKHDEFGRSPSFESQEAGQDAQLRTNLLVAGVAASGLATLVIGAFFTRWGSSENKVGRTP